MLIRERNIHIVHSHDILTQAAAWRVAVASTTTVRGWFTNTGSQPAICQNVEVGAARAGPRGGHVRTDPG